MFQSPKVIRGFTLVELLVVTAIMAILLAIATPLATGAINRGIASKCMGNLRQWGIALNLYIGDHYGRLPYEGWRENPTWAEVADERNALAWFNVLPPYVQQEALSEFGPSRAALLYQKGGYGGILQCPAARWQGNEAAAPGPRFSYAFNSQIFDADSGEDVRVASLNQASLRDGATNVNNRPVGPSNIPMLFDARASTAEPKTLPGMNNDAGTAFAYTRRANDRHERRVNLVFFDGSVRSHRAQEMMNASARNIPTSPMVWSPWNPDAE